MEKKISISSKKNQLSTLFVFFFLLVLFLVSISSLHLETDKLITRAQESGAIIQRFFHLNLSDWTTIVQELLVSICMAIAGLSIGFVISFILAFLGASNTTPHPILASCIKGTIAAIRAIPALVWILIVVASIGFGNTAGVIGLVFPTTGYLTKSFISSVEEQDDGVIEALKSTGAGWLQIMKEGLLPGLSKIFLSWTSIRLEANIAESISLGMVGAGGIGMLLTKAIGRYDYPTISTIILTIFLTMFSIELIIGKIKKKMSI